MRSALCVKRLLALALSLSLLLGLACLFPVTASAEGTMRFSFAQDCQRSPSFPKAGETLHAYTFDKPLNAVGGRYGEKNGSWTLTSMGLYGAGVSISSKYLSSVIAHLAEQYGIQAAQVEVYELKKDGTHVAYGGIMARSDDVIAFVGDNWSNTGSCYLLSNQELTGDVYTTIKQDLKTAANNSTEVKHEHSWQITGDNTDTLTATCVGTVGTCDAGGPVSVSISAKSVTLPESPFNAAVSNAERFEAVTGLKVHPLDTLNRVSYSYKAAGAGSFTTPDFASPKAGTYQAVIFVTDAQNVDHSAFVEYTAIDPKVTAATGDDRPVEAMALGLVMFSALAAAAFVLDGMQKKYR